MSTPRVDYDQIAENYDRRYQTDRYADAGRMLEEWIEESPRGRLLEVGCGTGHWLDALGRPGQTVLGLDRSGGMLARARQAAPDARLVRGDAAPLPLASGSVAALLCMNAFHHFPDKPAFIAEAARVLAPGAAFCTIGLDPHNFEEASHRRSVTGETGPHVRPPGERARHARQRSINAVHVRLDRPLRARSRDHVGPTDQNLLRRTADREDEHRDHAASGQQTTPDEDICHCAAAPATPDVSSRVTGRFSIVARI